MAEVLVRRGIYTNGSLQRKERVIRWMVAAGLAIRRSPRRPSTATEQRQQSPCGAEGSLTCKRTSTVEPLPCVFLENAKWFSSEPPQVSMIWFCGFQIWVYRRDTCRASSADTRYKDTRYCCRKVFSYLVSCIGRACSARILYLFAKQQFTVLPSP